jgi:hypothetical protein
MWKFYRFWLTGQLLVFQDWMSPRERADAARDLLRRSDRLLDLGFRVDLRAIADGDLDDLEERRRGPDTP